MVNYKGDAPNRTASVWNIGRGSRDLAVAKILGQSIRDNDKEVSPREHG